MLDPEALRNFLYIVDLGSLSKACRVAHLTQPSLSRQLGRLEEEIGEVLFDRTGRGMRVTLSGKRLELKVRPLLAEFENLRNEFVDAPVSGPLSVAVSPSVGVAWTAELVGRFRKKFPLIQLRIAAALSGSASDAIALGAFDIGIVYSPVDTGRLVLTELWQEPVYLVCKPGDELCRRDSVSLSEVLRESLVLPSSHFGIRALLEELAKDCQGEVKLELEVDSIQLALEFVRKGAGKLLLTERALSDIGARRLVALPVRRPQMVRSAAVVASETALLRSAVRAFWDFVIDDAAQSRRSTGVA